MIDARAQALLEQINGVAEYWAEKAENARFTAHLRGPSDDEPAMPFVRLFVDEVDVVVKSLRDLASLLASAVPAPPEKDDLDAGIRDTVKRLNDAGFVTTDSGDGTKADMDCALPFPHVAMQTTPDAMVAEAHRAAALLGGDWVVEASYATDSQRAILFARSGDWASAVPSTPEKDESLSETVEQLRAIPGAWKNRPDPLGELAAIRNGDPHTCTCLIDAHDFQCPLHGASPVPEAPPQDQYLAEVAERIIETEGCVAHDWLVGVAKQLKLRAEAPVSREQEQQP